MGALAILMIELHNVTQRYPQTGRAGERTALSEVDLRVAAGEFVCVLGPSGCGKSTLLNLAAGFLRPTTGQVRFDGREVTAPGPERGVVFQDPTLFPWLTVQANVEFGLLAQGLAPDERRQAASNALQAVGLADFAQAYPHTLSGGMKQRVALARVLVLEPRALLMDEPFGALDANSRERLQDELLRLWQAHRRTVLFVTHNVEEAAYLADRVVVMGPAPRSVRGQVAIELPRPRAQTDAALLRCAAQLRDILAQMPCCLAQSQGTSR